MNRNFQFIKHRRIWYTVSLVLIGVSILAISIFGFRYGLDFTGGSLLEIEYATTRPDNATVTGTLEQLGIVGVRLQPSGDRDLIVRMPEITEEQHQKALQALKDQAVNQDKGNSVTEKRFDSFGSSLGKELRQDAFVAIGLVLLAIIAYLSYAFRKVSKPMASWKYGIVAVIALFHDVTIVPGLFAVLGYFFGTEIDSLFITALLTLLGFSVHDTIVTLDRVRENLFTHQDQTFEQVVNRSINETITRSINTSVTTLFALLGVYFFGGASVKDFSLALIAGIIVGTYSSIFIAAPLLVTWYKLMQKRA